MSVYKRFNGKTVKHGDKNYSKGTWYYRFKIRGVLYHRSIPEATTLQQAKDAEQAVKNAVFDNRYKTLIDSTTFNQFIENVYRHYVKQHNVNVYSKMIFVKELTKFFGRMYLKDITPQDCRNYIALRKRTPTRNGRERAASSINKELSTLSKIFNLAIEENKIDDNPMRFVKLLKPPKPRDRILSAEERKRFDKELIKDKTLYRLATIALHTGLRRGQILAIKAEDVNLTECTIKAIASKGRESRLIPLNRTMIVLFSEVLKETPVGRIFPFNEFKKRWNNFCQRAKLEDFHFHDLKHIFATNLIKQGLHPEMIRLLFAHSDLKITETYLHPDQSLMHDAVKLLDDIQDLGEV